MTCSAETYLSVYVSIIYQKLSVSELKGTGTIVAVETFDGETETESDTFTWGTDGNKLTLVIDGDEETTTYIILGNKLTITTETGISVFTKV